MAFLGLDGQLRRLQLLTARIGASDTSTAAMMTEFMVGHGQAGMVGSSRVQLAVDGGGAGELVGRRDSWRWSWRGA